MQKEPKVPFLLAIAHIFDLASVEVLRGPQGTLFGRNTPAGVVKFESEKPKLGSFEGYYNVSAATHYTMNGEAAVNVPLADKWAMRVSAVGQHRDDYVDNFADVAMSQKRNELDGYNEHAERVQFLYNPDSSFSALLNLHQRNTNGSARLFRANLIQKGSNKIVPGYDLDKIVTNADNWQRLKTNGANLRLSWDLGNVRLFSVTGYEHVSDYFSRGDIGGGTPAGPGFIPFQVETGAYISKLDQYTQEFRLESKNAGPLNWQTGLYFFTDWSYRGKINFFLYEASEFVGAPLTEGGVRLGYVFGGGKYEVAVFGRNVLDQRRITGAIDFNNLTGFTNEPRQWGMQFKGNF